MHGECARKTTHMFLGGGGACVPNKAGCKAILFRQHGKAGPSPIPREIEAAKNPLVLLRIHVQLSFAHVDNSIGLSHCL